MALPPPFSRWRTESRPAFLAQIDLPALRTADGPLPEGAALRLLDRMRRGLREREIVAVLERCDEPSLDGLLLAVLDAWEAAGGPSAGAWIFRGLMALGRGTAVRSVGRRIERWARGRHVAWSVHGLTVLAHAASPAAVLTLTRLSGSSGDPRVRAEAGRALDRLAEAEGVDRAELEERLTPDLGLDARGRRVLDYGGRRFEVALDAQLVPWVLDDTGARRPDLPRPRGSDDPALAARARADLKALRQDARTLARTRVRALERAMRTQRSWTRDEFERRWVRPAALRSLTAQILWFTRDERGSSVFRVEDGGDLSNAREAPVELGPSAQITVAHPLLIPATERAAWRGVFDDYELVPPFAQLERSVHRWPEDALRHDRFDTCEGWRVHPAALRRLGAAGWMEEGDARTEALSLEVGEAQLWLRFYPGYRPRDLGDPSARVELEALVIEGPAADFEDVDEVTRSEVLRDLEAIAPRSG